MFPNYAHICLYAHSYMRSFVRSFTRSALSSGYLGKSGHLHSFLIPGDAAEYSKHLFRVLDSDNDNMVSWKEVMVGFHQLSPNGDPDAKLRLVYSVSFDFWRENSNILVF